MKKILFVLAASFLCFHPGEDAEIKYPVSEIPAELLEGANVVFREDNMVFTINSTSSGTYRYHYAVTILNAKGDSYASETVGYSKLIKVADFTAAVYDAQGKLIKRLKNNEIVDQSALDGVSLYSDVRMKHADLSQSIYPYTVEFEYQIEFKYLYSIPGTVIGGENVSVQNASYQLIYPANIAPRYLALNIKETPVAITTGSIHSVKWKFQNMRPISFEPNGPPDEELLPQIMAAPSLFEYEGYKGDMQTWKEYGKWNLQLNAGRSELPQPTKQKVKELTKDLTTTEEKAKALYLYLQNKTRYVGIQVGIGGLQPFPASVVDETGYGDCKALSNYMIALLAEAGIKGYYTLIQAGENEPEVVLAFPSHQNNHAIVAVPAGKDTLWMECTSQTKPFGYMGTFTGDRYALMITEEGGKIVRTPEYNADQNKQTRSATVIVDGQGNAKATIRTMYAGIQSENDGLDYLLENQFDEQKKWIQKNTLIPNFTVNSFSISGTNTKIPVATVKLDLTLPRYASVSGKRLFLTPNIMNKTRFIPEKIEARQTDVVRYNSYLDIDTVNFQFPENLYPEFLPHPVKLTSRFGEYEASFQFNEGSLVYIRKMKVWKGRFPKESYNELVEFYKNVSKSDNVKLVFLNKT